MELKRTPPRDAVKRYLKRKKAHVSDKTHYNYATALERFLEYLDERGITDLRDVDSNEIARFEEWRLADVKPITCRNDMRTVKNFIEFCESIQAVPVDLHELIQITRVSEDDEICDDILTREEANAILDHLDKYQYASLRHVILLVLWKCGMRIGGLRALDLGDFDEARPAIELRHRPDTETPLKRKENSERNVIITQEAATSSTTSSTNSGPAWKTNTAGIRSSLRSMVGPAEQRSRSTSTSRPLRAFTMTGSVPTTATPTPAKRPSGATPRSVPDRSVLTRYAGVT